MAYKRLVPPRIWAFDSHTGGNGRVDGDRINAQNITINLPRGLKEIYIMGKYGAYYGTGTLPVVYTASDTSMDWDLGASAAKLLTSSKTYLTLPAFSLNQPKVIVEHFKSDAAHGIAGVSVPAADINVSYSGEMLGGKDITNICIKQDWAWLYWMIISEAPVARTEKVAVVTPKIASTGWTAGTDGSDTTSKAGATLTLTAPDDPSGATVKSMQAYVADATGGTLKTLKIGEKSNTLTSAAATYYGDVTTDKSITLKAES